MSDTQGKSGTPDIKLTSEIKEKAKELINTYNREAFNRLEKSCTEQTKYNFLVNTGGSAAILAFLAAKADSTFAIWPLAFFVTGVIACGVSSLATVFLERGIFDEGSDISRKLNSATLLEEITPSDVTKWYSYKIAKYTNYFAFGIFIAGVIAGGFAYWWTTPSGATIKS